MSYLLYINGNLIDLLPTTVIAQTKQVNDIASLESRQSNFTNTFTAPLTANNIRSLGRLSIVGNQSNLPYQKNVCDLFDAKSGVCKIYKGWAIINQAAKGFEIYVYDGVVDFYKAIENRTLGELELSELNHTKDLETVLESFDDLKPYKYILADYNGKALFDTDKINIDYLVPSLRVSWLVDKIETFTGFNLSGSFKTNPDYLNLWMTYPKGTEIDLGKTNIFHSNDVELNPRHRLKIITYDLLDEITLLSDKETFKTSSQIVLNITLSHYRYVYPKGTGPSLIQLWMKKNGVRHKIMEVRQGGSVTTVTFDVLLNSDDEVKFYYTSFLHESIDPYVTPSEIFAHGGFKEILIKKYNSISIDFLEELKEFSIKDLLNEIIWRLSSTLFKKKYSNDIDFKTVSEITNKSNAVDWSSEFISIEGEKYIYGNYAQKNYMQFKYNDDNANYNDGHITVVNENLEDSKPIIKSKIYSPEKLKTTSLGFETNVYKLWNKEPNDNSETTYTALANRFYFLRSVDKIFDAPIVIGSEATGTSETIAEAPVESFLGLTFAEIINTNYPDIQRILNQAKVVVANIYLTEKDVENIDFSVPYFIEQESSYFMLNKIIGFTKAGATKCELIRLK